MKAKTTKDRWHICKRAKDLTGINVQTIFSLFDQLDGRIYTTAATGTQEDRQRLQDHIAALVVSKDGYISTTKVALLEAGTVTEDCIDEPMPVEASPPDMPVAVAVLKPSTTLYIARLRLTLWFIAQCGGIKQAQFLLNETAKAFPDDTAPAFEEFNVKP